MSNTTLPPALAGQVEPSVRRLDATLKLELPWCETHARKSGKLVSAVNSRNRVDVTLFREGNYEGAPIAMELETYEIDSDNDDVKRGFGAYIKVIGRRELMALRDLLQMALMNIEDGEDA